MRYGNSIWAGAAILASLVACASSVPAAKPLLPPLARNPGGEMAVSSAATPQSDAELLKQGYQRRIYRGQTVYCRVESQTGSRFTGKVCHTAEELRSTQRDAQQVLGTVRSDSTCTMTKCN